MRADVIAVGDVLLDVDVGATPRTGERRHTAIGVRAGGSAVNAALAAARAGVRAAVVARVGADATAEIVRVALGEAGVGCTLAVDPERRTGTAVALSGGAVAADPGASAWLSPADLPDRLDAGAVLVSGYTLLTDSSAEAARAAIERANAPWIAVNVASANLVRRHGADETLARAGRANLIFANADEASALTGAGPSEAARLLGDRFELACVTDGAAGALAVIGPDVHECRPEAPRPGEAWGAGDAFAGTMLAALARGLPVPDALAAAVAAS